MGTDTFLKLLVAQLKYQDPSKPADGTALLGQTAQFQMVEKLQLLADQNIQLLSSQQASSAIALVGRTISYTEGDRTLSGVVGSVRLTAGGPVLAVGQTDVPLSSVTKISSAG
jgi:flagellar basal-body rod modification protein FlgD